MFENFPALMAEARVGAYDPALHDVFEAANEEFEAVIAQAIPLQFQARSFYASVAGTSHPNVDGSRRTEIIARCDVFETLMLDPEPENPYDRNAVAVRKWSDRAQLGYLDARLASEVTRDQGRNGPRWMSIFRRKTLVPGIEKIVGAVIYMIRLDDEFVERREKEQPGSVIQLRN